MMGFDQSFRTGTRKYRLDKNEVCVILIVGAY